MRVAVYFSNSDVRIEDRPRPEIGRGEALLRVRASGICGSDLMEWYRVPRAPVVLGHEVAGTIEEVGASVDSLRPGDRVVTTHHVPCGSCRYCLSDRHAVCPMLHRTTFEPGGLAELVRLPAENVRLGTLRLPEHVSFEQGSFVEPLACVVRGQRLAGLRAGDAVAVIGSGVSGLLHLQLARANGAARVVAIDTSDARLAAARRFGADLALRADAPDLEARVREGNDGRLPERVVVCAAARSAIERALALVDDGGTVLPFAPLAPGEQVSFEAWNLFRRGIALVHTYAGPPDDMRTALDLIASGRIDVTSMITDRLGLSDAARAFRLAAAGGSTLKVVLDPGR
jgi:L-iditol 2-dehydrogenase